MPDDHRPGGCHPTVWIDDPLTVDNVAVRIQHIQQLRTALINEITTRNGVPGAYSDDPLLADSPLGRDVHINEPNAQAAVMHAAPRCITDTTPAPALSNVTVGDAEIRAHITALRAYINLNENVECFCDCDYVCADNAHNSHKSDCGDNAADM